MNIYRILANSVALIHWLLIVLLFTGFFISKKYPGYEKYHLFLTLATIISQVVFLGCPLVVLENSLRRQYDPKATFNGSFVCYYVETYLGHKIPPQYITVILIIIVIASALLVS